MGASVMKILSIIAAKMKYGKKCDIGIFLLYFSILSVQSCSIMFNQEEIV